MTTENKVLLGIGVGVGGLYLVANAAPSETTFGSDAVLSSVDDSAASSGSGSLWIYIIVIIVILALGAYIAREVAG
jgi:hypothetical protein